MAGRSPATTNELDPRIRPGAGRIGLRIELRHVADPLPWPSVPLGRGVTDLAVIFGDLRAVGGHGARILRRGICMVPIEP